MAAWLRCFDPKASWLAVSMHCRAGYEELQRPNGPGSEGALVCATDGKASARTRCTFPQARGTMFMSEGERVRGGMIVGESNTENLTSRCDYIAALPPVDLETLAVACR
jgi:predicted membrane GTPase involved in stress response